MCTILLYTNAEAVSVVVMSNSCLKYSVSIIFMLNCSVRCQLRIVSLLEMHRVSDEWHDSCKSKGGEICILSSFIINYYKFIKLYY